MGDLTEVASVVDAQRSGNPDAMTGSGDGSGWTACQASHTSRPSLPRDGTVMPSAARPGADLSGGRPWLSRSEVLDHHGGPGQRRELGQRIAQPAAGQARRQVGQALAFHRRDQARAEGQAVVAARSARRTTSVQAPGSPR
jgi:hypothetical protein